SSFFPVPPDVLLAPLTLGCPKKWLRFALNCSIASVLGGIVGYGIGIFLWSLVGTWFYEHVPGFNYDTISLKSQEKIECRIDPSCVSVKGIRFAAEVKYPLSINTKSAEKMTIEAIDVSDVNISPFTKVSVLYNDHDWQAVGLAGFTPLPFKVFTITAGVIQIDFLIFCLAAALSRSARFFLVAGLFRWGGPKMKPFIDKYFNWLCLAFMVLLLGGFLLLKYL
ncbi:MAG: hypothetical protein JW709_06745, partial [Sedimentisphaerales bacterium]|nr:hypothetical protein [Sedimentisphaerales bacterium]